MGAIYHHNVQQIKDKHNLEYYVETGTGEGACLSHVLNFNFKKFYSVEIHQQVYNNVINKFKDKNNCEILLGNSYEVLPDILSKIEGNVLFFLDAHFPGADFKYATYDAVKDYDTRLPLEKELRTICNNRDTSKDVFIIDDLRIYEDNNYSGGNWEARKRIGGDNIDFIFELFEETHIIERDLRHQGFIILTPKNVE